MSIIITNDGDRVVSTIAERDAIPLAKRFQGMMVSVEDSIADPQTGGGFAKYEWFNHATNPRWVLIQLDNKVNGKIKNEVKTIVNGAVVADFIPMDDTVWQARIVDSVTGVVLGDIQPVVTLYDIDLGTLDYDGHNLEFTYAYGTFSAQLDSIIYELRNKSAILTNPVIDLKDAVFFRHTVIQNTTFSVINVQAEPIVDSFIIELIDGGSFSVTWPANVEWEHGVAPALTANGKDLITFFSYDNGLTWRGVVIGNDMKVVS